MKRQKNYPDRFPINSDSIGIELVGMHIDKKTYKPVTACQNVSLQWLIGELYTHFGLDKHDVVVGKVKVRTGPIAGRNPLFDPLSLTLSWRERGHNSERLN